MRWRARAARLGFSAELGSRRSGQGVASLGDTTIEDGDKSSRFFQGAADRHEILHTAVVDDLAKRRWGGDYDEGAIVIAQAAEGLDQDAEPELVHAGGSFEVHHGGPGAARQVVQSLAEGRSGLGRQVSHDAD